MIISWIKISVRSCELSRFKDLCHFLFRISTSVRGITRWKACSRIIYRSLTTGDWRVHPHFPSHKWQRPSSSMNACTRPERYKTPIPVQVSPSADQSSISVLDIQTTVIPSWRLETCLLLDICRPFSIHMATLIADMIATVTCRHCTTYGHAYVIEKYCIVDNCCRC